MNEKRTKEDLVEEIANRLRYAFCEKIHPTKLLIEAIEEVYGHKVELKKLIDLIESSPLRVREKV